MRKLASVRRIDEIVPIENADFLECAVVGGWKVVVKKGEYQPGDLAIYIEIDSFVPNSIAPFLTKPGQNPKEYEGISGERLKTIKLRGQISQGLLLPLSYSDESDGRVPVIVTDTVLTTVQEGSDVTELLGIKKWEAPIPAQLGGIARGNFPTSVPKTDQERIQNLKKDLEKWKNSIFTWEVTEKLDGSSATFYLSRDGIFEVCSRNLSLTFNEDNSFWKIAKKYDIEQKMRDHGMFGVAIQGELVGEGIQGNRYNIKGVDFFVFDMYNTFDGKYLDGDRRRLMSDLLGLKHCPVINPSLRLRKSDTVDFLLKYAEEKSQLNPKAEREGLVFKCNEDPNFSWKAISNLFLMKTEG